jgi:hypothetical protein
MNTYIFSPVEKNGIRTLHLDEDENGVKSVVKIYEMYHDGSYESLKATVKNLYEMMFIGEDGEYEVYGTRDDKRMEYEPRLEGKARKRSSKEINVLSIQLYYAKVVQGIGEPISIIRFKS